MVYTVFIEDFERFGEPGTSVYVLDAPSASQAQADAVARYCVDEQRYDFADYTFTTRPQVTFSILGAPVHPADRDGASYTDTRSDARRRQRTWSAIPWLFDDEED